MNTHDREESLTLEILETIEQQSNVTQRHLAESLGVALGLANSYLKRCVRKGLVKIHQAPANRYLYYLTPKGFAEKSRLTAEYLTTSFDFYRQAGESLTHIYNECEQMGYHKILFCGVSELAEIASLRCLEHELKIVGVFDPECRKKQFLHLPVWNSLADTDVYDICIITTLKNPAVVYESLIQEIDPEKVLVPSILGISLSSQDTDVPSPATGETNPSSHLMGEGQGGGD